jgi:hypothetical protein
MVLLLNEFARGHQLREKHSSHAGRIEEMGCDDSSGKGNYCSMVT